MNAERFDLSFRQKTTRKRILTRFQPFSEQFYLIYVKFRFSRHARHFFWINTAGIVISVRQIALKFLFFHERLLSQCIIADFIKNEHKIEPMQLKIHSYRKLCSFVRTLPFSGFLSSSERSDSVGSILSASVDISTDRHLSHQSLSHFRLAYFFLNTFQSVLSMNIVHVFPFGKRTNEVTGHSTIQKGSVRIFPLKKTAPLKIHRLNSPLLAIFPGNSHERKPP